MSPDNLLGWFASGLVFAAFCAEQMTLLRSLAIASNFAFIGYGYLASLWPILILHSAMLPINILRYRQSVRRFCDAGTEETGTQTRRKPSVGRTVWPGNFITAALGRLRSWREREGFRRQLASMSARDFRDLKVPPSLVADELRRWPWQKPTPQWRTVGSKWSATYRDDVDNLRGN